MMKTLLGVVALGLLVTGCVTTSDSVKPGITNTVVIQAPANLYKCPYPKKPDLKALSDSNVADYLNRLYNARATCKASLKAIENYSDRAAKTITH
jgi:PBP1b-binding outer membrane lipoprotein LpoB